MHMCDEDQTQHVNPNSSAVAEHSGGGLMLWIYFAATRTDTSWYAKIWLRHQIKRACEKIHPMKAQTLDFASTISGFKTTCCHSQRYIFSYKPKLTGKTKCWMKKPLTLSSASTPGCWLVNIQLWWCKRNLVIRKRGKTLICLSFILFKDSNCLICHTHSMWYMWWMNWEKH